MIYYDVLTGCYFEESDDLVTRLFNEFYIDEVKLVKDAESSQFWEFTKTAKIVSIKYYYDWLIENIYAGQKFWEIADRVADLFSARKIQLDITTALSEQSKIVVVLDCRFTM